MGRAAALWTRIAARWTSYIGTRASSGSSAAPLVSAVADSQVPFVERAAAFASVCQGCPAG